MEPNQTRPFGKPLPVLLDCVPRMTADAPGPRFKTTSWSLVLAAAEPSSRTVRALESLCQQYWRPVYGFIRRNGYPSDQAQDLTHPFFPVDGREAFPVEPEGSRAGA
jgi:hypothetical protein